MYIMLVRISLPLISRKKLASGLKMIFWHSSTFFPYCLKISGSTLRIMHAASHTLKSFLQS